MDIYTSKKRSEIMSRVRSRDTKVEIIVREKVRSLGYRLAKNKGDLPGKPDIVINKLKCVIFINGCFWHHHSGCPKSRLPKTNKSFWKNKITNNVKRDKNNYAKLRKDNWKVLVIWECEIMNGKYENKLSKYLKELMNIKNKKIP